MKYNYNPKKISWNEVKGLTKLIENKIKKEKIKIDVIIPILRGGMPLALILSQSLGIRHFETIQIVKSVNDKINSVFNKAKAINHTDMKFIYNKNILIAEDVIDTLDTLNTTVKFVKKYRPRNIFVATLINFAGDNNYNIFSGKHYRKEKYWIIFPWD